jgi:N-acetylmuramoyl-L-alanine amidase
LLLPRITLAFALASAAVLCSFGGAARIVQAAMWPGMEYGSRGAGVEELQSRLGFLGYYHSYLNGAYTWPTYWAVRDFQWKFGMPVTGVANAATLAMLRRATTAWPGTGSASALRRWQATRPPALRSRGGGTASAPMAAATSPAPVSSAYASSAAAGMAPAAGSDGYSRNDILLMAHVVYGEARNQPFVGQVAVAAVILNRDHSSLFPHSIPAIVYQPGEFSSIDNGQAWLGLHKENVEAVLDAIHGYDPTHGALYYWNPATAASTWVWSQPVILRIGDHVFAK